MLEYDVKVKGVEDLDKLTRAVNSLESVLKASKGSGKGLEEVRKVIVGLKGQDSVFKTLAESIKNLDPAVTRLEKTFVGVGSTLSATLKSEMDLTRATLRTEIATLAKGLGSPLASRIEAELGGGLEDGTRAAVKRGKTAAAKARAEMTAAYENLVDKNGLKQLTTDQMAEVAMLKDVGASISAYHSRMIANYEGHLQKQRLIDRELVKQDQATAAEQKLIAERKQASLIASLNAEIAVRKQKAAETAAIAQKNQADLLSSLNAEIAVRKQRAAEAARLEGQIRAMTSKAYDTPGGAYSSLNTGGVLGTAAQIKAYEAAMRGADSTTKTFRGNAAAAATDLGRFSTQAGDAHAAVRGLASGFNLLWLTWGNLGPLMAGAALSNTFMKSAKEGMQVAHTMEVIGTLGEASKDQVSALHGELLRLGSTGVRGPIEIANAMQTLVLAGVKVNDVIKETKNVLDFSVAGTTSIENAADVLVSVTTAFGTGAAGFTRTADIIMRAAADSKASVESFGEAMKTASVVGEQYGATQEDVAALISLLANLGIQGSAAGTAIRNMYADLSGRTQKTAKIMQRFGLDFRDANGNMLPLLQTVGQLSKALHQMDPKGAKDFLQAILSERGGKAMVAALADYNKQIVTAEGHTNELAERIAKLQKAQGDSALAAARLGETTQSAWQRAAASMSTTLDKVFAGMEPQLYRMANSMTALFNDPGFIAGLSAIGSGIASLGAALADNIGLLTTIAALWGGWKLAAVAVNAVLPATTVQMLRLNAANLVASAGFSRLTGVTQQATAAALAKAAADRAATAAAAASAAATAGTVSVLGRLGAILPGIGTALAVGAVAWDLYSAASSRANSAVQLAKGRSDNVIKNIEARTKALDAETEAIRRGEDAAAAAELSQLRTSQSDALDPIRKEQEELKRIWERAAKDRAHTEELANKASLEGVRLSAERGVAAKKAAEDKAFSNYKASLQAQADLDSSYYDTEQRLRDAQGRNSKAKAEQAAKEKEASERTLKDFYTKMGLKEGDLNFSAADPYGSGGQKFSRGPSAASLYLDTEFEKFKKLSEAERGIVDGLYEQGKISAGEYYDWVAFKSDQTYNQERIALVAKIAALSGDPKSAKATKQAEVDLAVLDMKYTAETAKLEVERTRTVAERLTPMQKINAAGEEYLNSLRQSEAELVAIRRGGVVAEMATAQAKIHEDFSKQRLDIEKRFISDSAKLDGEGLVRRQAERDAELESIASFEYRAFEIVKTNEAMKAAERANGFNGVQRAMDNYLKETTDAASLMESTTSSVLRSFEDNVVSAMTTGKFAIKDFVVSALADLAKLYTKQALGGLVQMFGNAAISYFGGGGWSAAGVQSSGAVTSAVSGAGSMGSYNLPSMTLNALGGVYESPSLSSYSNQVHNSPKLFAFAQGGVFGEAGAEAIMPLTRGPDGNLGVRQFGSGGGSPIINITTQINVDSGGNATSSASASSGGGGMENIMSSMANQINAMQKEQLIREMKPGGIIWKGLHNYA